ncbi:MAG: LacI family DNA-binding transcriptional regulator [Chloroflexota bacterium]
MSSQTRQPGRGRAAPTMQDVATSAGVSTKTVSRVINREPGVHPDTVATVSAAIGALGYRRNDAARNLRKGIATDTVGLLIEDLANPFYAQLASAVEQVSYRNGHAVVVMSSGEDPVRERELVADLLRRGVNGLVIVPAGQDHRYLANGHEPRAPVVFLDRPPMGVEADSVVMDDVAGGRRATQHLLSHGHRRIGYVGDALSVTTSAARLQGYREAHKDVGLEVDEALVRLNPARVNASEASTRRLLSLPLPPTAILAQNNRNCIGVLRALRGGPPIALIGFDDIELADMLPVPLTVVASDPGEMGRSGAELLFARMAGDSRPPQRIVIPTRVVARGSGEIPPPATERQRAPRTGR